MNEHGRIFRISRLLLVVLILLPFGGCGKVKHNAPPAITSASSGTFVEGIAGTFSVTATGYPAPVLILTGAAGGTVPNWLTLNPQTGILSGTPTAGSSGAYTLTITASNGNLPDASQTFTLSVAAAVQTVRIVHDGTTGNEANIVANLSAIVTAVPGLSAATSVGVPVGNLGALKQVWDVRYNTVLTQAEVTSYETCLSGGGTLVLIGTPVTGFTARNNSITALISTLGGGTITVIPGNTTQTVLAPFNGSLTTVTFPVSPGDAQNFPVPAATLITQDTPTLGAGIFFNKTLNSPYNNGRLMAVFDFNFLLSSDVNLKQLTTNMVTLP